MINLVKSKDFYILFGLYLLANTLLLLNVNGLYWDDWVAYKQEIGTLQLFFSEIQHGIKGDFFLFVSQYGNAIYPFRLFVFFATFLMGLFVYLILSSIKEIDKQSTFFITLLFLVSPLNSAKISIAVVPFLFPVLIFYFAFYLLTLYIKHPNILFRVLILTLFFASFSTNSILVFYFSIFLYLYFIEFNFKFDHLLEKAKYLLKRYWDFLALPFIYFIYKSIYLKPYGAYEGYNSVSLDTLPKAIKILFKNFDNSLIEVLCTSLNTLTSVWIYIVLVLYFIIRKSQSLEEHAHKKLFLWVGIILFVLAVFPYAMVGKNAEFESWNSRFQVLIPLGFAFIVYFAILSLKKYASLNQTIVACLLWLVIFALIGKNISDQYKEHVDWFYSVSIRENLKNNDLIKNHSTFIVNNNIKDSLLYNRDMIYYELNGISKSAFGDEKKLLIRYDHYKENVSNLSKIKQHKAYNFSQWEAEKPLLLTLSYNYKEHAGQHEYIQMIYLNLLNHQKFLTIAKNLTTITVNYLPSNNNE